MIWLKRLGVSLLGGLFFGGAIICLREAGLPTIWDWGCLGAVAFIAAANAVPAPWEIK